MKLLGSQMSVAILIALNLLVSYASIGLEKYTTKRMLGLWEIMKIFSISVIG